MHFIYNSYATVCNNEAIELFDVFDLTIAYS